MLFLIVTCIGALLVAIGMVFLPFEAHFQLDQVLSAEELRDEKLRNRILEILHQVSIGRKEGPLVAISGSMLIGVGVVGLFATTRK